MIIDAGDEIIGVIEKLYAVNLPKNFSIETLEQKRLHYGMLYEELCDHNVHERWIKESKEQNPNTHRACNKAICLQVS